MSVRFGARSMAVWLPVAVFAGVVLTLIPMGLNTTWEPNLLLPLMNTIVFVTVSLAAAVFATIAFRDSGNLLLLLFACGILVFGLGNAYGPFLLTFGGANAGVTGHNIDALLGGLLLFVAGLVPAAAEVPRPRRPVVLIFSLAGSVLCATLVALAAWQEIVTPFLTPTGTSTPIRVAVLSVAIAAFAGAACMSAVRAWRVRQRFIEWHAAGLTLTGLGLAAVAFATVGSVLGWTGRLSQDLGQIYLLASLVGAQRQTGGAGSRRKNISESFTRMQSALEEAEARTAQLIRYAPAAICEVKLAPARLTMVNDGMCAISGYSRDELLKLDPIEMVCEDDRERFREWLRAGDFTGGTTVKVCRRDGTTLIVLMNVQPTYADDGTVQTVFMIGHDVTERQSIADRLQESQERLQLALSAGALAAWDRDLISGTATWSDEHYRLFGYEPGDVEPTIDVWLERIHPDDVDRARDTLAQAIHMGGDYSDQYRIRLPDGAVHWIEARGRVEMRDGVAARCYGVLMDYTERKQREIELAEAAAYEREHARLRRALITIGGLAHATLQRHHAFDEVLAEAAAALGADFAAIATRRENGWSLDDVHGGAFHEGLMVRPEDAPGLELVAETGRSLAAENAGEHEVTRDALLRHVSGAESLLMAPAMVRGRTVAVVVLAWREPRRFDANEIWFAERLGVSISLALANIELYEAEHHLAETLQETLVVLPTHVPGIRFCRAYESATSQAGHVGGDFIDVFQMGRHCVGLTLGDVSGKGIDAAVTTALVRTAVRVHAVDGLEPREIAAKVNRLLCGSLGGESFVTLWFGTLNTRTGELRYVSAGHPPALRIPADGPLEQLECKDRILGAFEEAAFIGSETRLRPGDRLAIYSDGVTEARNRAREFLGLHGMMKIIERDRGLSTSKLCDSLIGDVVAFSEGVLRDDVAVLVVEPTRLRRSRSASVAEVRQASTD